MGDQAKRVRVFLDTSALFAGIWSDAGGARMILKLGESRALEIWAGPQVLREIEAVICRKTPGATAFLALLLDRSGIRVVAAPSAKSVQEWLPLTGHPGDARVLAEACGAGADYLVTLDKEHLLNRQVLRKAAPFPIGTPGDFLSWYRQQLLSSRI
jgi:predicted nucleic acid-binding protein